MKKFAVLSAMAVLAAAGAAQAQTGAAAAATLRLRIVPVDVTSASPLNLAFQGDNVHNTVGATDTNRTRRFSIQYSIAEGAAFEGFIASLASLQMNITSSVSGGGLSSISFDRSALTRNQGGGASTSQAPAGATDTSGNTIGATAGVAGLHNIWRGGLSPATAAGNALPSNGTIVPGGINLITPLSLSQRDQFPVNNPSAWYGLFDFEVTVGDAGPADAVVNLAVNAVADAQTGNSWGAYEDQDPIPRTSANSVGGAASFTVVAIPAPGALALVGLGGLVAARRRRA